MQTKIVIGLWCIAAVLAWTGVAGAQAAPATPKVQLPNGDTVWDLSGDWDAFVENYGEYARFGMYPQVFRITHTTTGSTFTGIRVKNNPPPSPERAGSPSLRGELDKNGFKDVWTIDGSGQPWPSKGQISEDGNKITIEEGTKARAILTRFPGM